jgi:hypothetical protein
MGTKNTPKLPCLGQVSKEKVKTFLDTSNPGSCHHLIQEDEENISEISTV